MKFLNQWPDARPRQQHCPRARTAPGGSHPSTTAARLLHRSRAIFLDRGQKFINLAWHDLQIDHIHVERSCLRGGLLLAGNRPQRRSDKGERERGNRGHKRVRHGNPSLCSNVRLAAFRPFAGRSSSNLNDSDFHDWPKVRPLSALQIRGLLAATPMLVVTRASWAGARRVLLIITLSLLLPSCVKPVSFFGYGAPAFAWPDAGPESRSEANLRRCLTLCTAPLCVECSPCNCYRQKSNRVSALSQFVLSPGSQALDPCGEYIQNVAKNLCIILTRPRWHMKRMICIGEQLERCAPA